MTDALAARCARAMHVLTPAGTMLRAGRASLYVLDRLGWRTARLAARPPFVWIVELGYWLVARHRGLASRMLVRGRG